MKLRNKTTGEIGEPRIQYQEFYIDTENHMTYCYKTLRGMYEEWEDYEEPNVYYYISDFGAIRECEIGKFPEDEEDRKQIGNYFETKEEAEKVVEKLKAWKRLKAEIVGWSFSYDLDLNGCDFNDEDIVVGIKLPRNTSIKDLKLLFGGEDE